MAHQEVSHSRRYSDFEWLQKSLENEFKGVLVPQIPEKDALCMSYPFCRILVADVVQSGSHLRLFNTGEDSLASSCKDSSRTHNSASQRFAVSPELFSRDQSLDVFLTATRDEFNATKEAPVAEKAGESGSFFTSVVKNVTSIATNLTTEVQVGCCLCQN